MNEVLTRLKRSLGSKQEIAQYIADQLVIEIPFESAPIQATTPITFEQLYSFVKPTDPIELWSPENKRLAVLIATHQQSTVDDVVEIMKCGPCDWSSPEKAALAKKLGK